MEKLTICHRCLQALCLHQHLHIIIVFLYLIATKVDCQQSFATTPVNTTVIEGEDAMLNCAVDNLSGTILWSKDNTMLGSDRILPGYDRYSVIGTASREGNLRIQRAELGDDAEYRCHVTATDATNQNLRSDPAAALIVQIAPEAPVFDNYANGTVITVQPPATVSLACRANNGKPAATITWLKDDELLPYSTPEVTSSPSADPSGKKVNTVSTLTLNPEQQDNGISYQCQVSHPALPAPLTTGITLNVQFPPAPPIITGYFSGRICKVGDPVTLECYSTGGNPLAEVYWYKNDERMDYSYITDASSARNVLPLIIDYSDNNAVYKCQATSVVLDEPMSTEIRLNVNFAPAYVNITGHENMVRSGDTLTLKCTSAKSNPAATISWITGGRDLKTNEDVITPAPNGGFITSQELVIVATAVSASVDYSCHATNPELQETTIETVTVNVMVPPNPPIILDPGVSVFRAGNVLRLTCRATRGNPLATLTWYKNGQLITEGVTPRTSGIAATSVMEAILDQTDNGALYACNASNEATPVPLQANITLDVLFPPSTVTVTVAPTKVKEGDRVEMTCQTSSSNPQSTISWLRNGIPFDGPEVGVEEVTDAENGGWSTRRELTLDSVTAANNGGVYLCRAMSDILVESVNDGMTLDVRYKPKISTPNGISLSNHEEPGLIILNCSAEGNPSAITHTWKKNGEDINFAAEPRYTLSDTGSLLIHNVTRTEVGTYMCVASNEEGQSNITATLDVMYSAKITTGKAITIALNTPGELICEADANPKPPNFIAWTRPGFDLSGYTHEYVDGRGIMRIDNVTKAVGGMYTCNADNGISPADSKNIQVILQYAPEIDRSLPSKVAKSIGQTALLRCLAEGAPNVQFDWFKGTEEVNLTSTQYTLDLRQDLTFSNRYESRLIISQINEIEDYGMYVCRAHNDHGEARFQIQLEKTSPPEAPSNLQVVSVSFDKVTLNWTAGFDGGLDQTFEVRVNQKGGKQYKYVTVQPSDATTFTVTNLNSNTEYEFTVRGSNDEGDGPYYLGIVSTRTEVKPTEPPVQTSGRLLVGNIPLYMVLLFSFLCIIACVVCNIFTCCCLVRRNDPCTKRVRVGDKSTKKKPKKEEIELVKAIEKEEMKAETDSDNVSRHTPDDYADRYSYDNMSYDRHYDDYNDQRSEEYDHYDDHGPLPPMRGSGRGMMAPGYYPPSYRPPSYAASWDSYGNPPSSGLSESQIEDEQEREYADMLRRHQQRAHSMGPGGSIYTSSAPSPVPSSLGNFVPLSKGNSRAPSQAGSEEGYLV